MKSPWIVFLAQGLGTGRSPRGPGTVGSLLGLVWTWVLMLPGHAGLFWIGALAALPAAVWVCSLAEEILGQHDPGSIVLDEIVAVPFCFTTHVAAQALGPGFSGPAHFLASHPWWLVPLLFIGFRVFDIAKPWPVRQSQVLPRGWGVVADDILAAAWVNVPCLLIAGWVPGCCGGS